MMISPTKEFKLVPSTSSATIREKLTIKLNLVENSPSALAIDGGISLKDIHAVFNIEFPIWFLSPALQTLLYSVRSNFDTSFRNSIIYITRTCITTIIERGISMSDTSGNAAILVKSLTAMGLVLFGFENPIAREIILHYIRSHWVCMNSIVQRIGCRGSLFTLGARHIVSRLPQIPPESDWIIFLETLCPEVVRPIHIIEDYLDDPSVFSYASRTILPNMQHFSETSRMTLIRNPGLRSTALSEWMKLVTLSDYIPEDIDFETMVGTCLSSGISAMSPDSVAATKLHPEIPLLMIQVILNKAEGDSSWLIPPVCTIAQSMWLNFDDSGNLFPLLRRVVTKLLESNKSLDGPPSVWFRLATGALSWTLHTGTLQEKRITNFPENSKFLINGITPDIFSDIMTELALNGCDDMISGRFAAPLVSYCLNKWPIHDSENIWKVMQSWLLLDNSFKKVPEIDIFLSLAGHMKFNDLISPMALIGLLNLIRLCLLSPNDNISAKFFRTVGQLIARQLKPPESMFAILTTISRCTAKFPDDCSQLHEFFRAKGQPMAGHFRMSNRSRSTFWYGVLIVIYEGFQTVAVTAVDSSGERIAFGSTLKSMIAVGSQFADLLSGSEAETVQRMSEGCAVLSFETNDDQNAYICRLVQFVCGILETLTALSGQVSSFSPSPSSPETTMIHHNNSSSDEIRSSMTSGNLIVKILAETSIRIIPYLEKFPQQKSLLSVIQTADADLNSAKLTLGLGLWNTTSSDNTNRWVSKTCTRSIRPASAIYAPLNDPDSNMLNMHSDLVAISALALIETGSSDDNNRLILEALFSLPARLPGNHRALKSCLDIIVFMAIKYRWIPSLDSQTTSRLWEKSIIKGIMMVMGSATNSFDVNVVLDRMMESDILILLCPDLAVDWYDLGLLMIETQWKKQGRDLILGFRRSSVEHMLVNWLEHHHHDYCETAKLEMAREILVALNGENIALAGLKLMVKSKNLCMASNSVDKVLRILFKLVAKSYLRINGFCHSHVNAYPSSLVSYIRKIGWMASQHLPTICNQAAEIMVTLLGVSSNRMGISVMKAIQDQLCHSGLTSPIRAAMSQRVAACIRSANRFYSEERQSGASVIDHLMSIITTPDPNLGLRHSLSTGIVDTSSFNLPKIPSSIRIPLIPWSELEVKVTISSPLAAFYLNVALKLDLWISHLHSGVICYIGSHLMQRDLSIQVLIQKALKGKKECLQSTTQRLFCLMQMNSDDENNAVGLRRWLMQKHPCNPKFDAALIAWQTRRYAAAQSLMAAGAMEIREDAGMTEKARVSQILATKQRVMDEETRKSFTMLTAAPRADQKGPSEWLTPIIKSESIDLLLAWITICIEGNRRTNQWSQLTELGRHTSVELHADCAAKLQDWGTLEDLVTSHQLDSVLARDLDALGKVPQLVNLIIAANDKSPLSLGSKSPGNLMSKLQQVLSALTPELEKLIPSLPYLLSDEPVANLMSHMVTSLWQSQIDTHSQLVISTGGARKPHQRGLLSLQCLIEATEGMVGLLGFLGEFFGRALATANSINARSTSSIAFKPEIAFYHLICRWRSRDPPAVVGLDILSDLFVRRNFLFALVGNLIMRWPEVLGVTPNSQQTKPGLPAMSTSQQEVTQALQDISKTMLNFVKSARKVYGLADVAATLLTRIRQLPHFSNMPLHAPEVLASTLEKAKLLISATEPDKPIANWLAALNLLNSSVFDISEYMPDIDLLKHLMENPSNTDLFRATLHELSSNLKSDRTSQFLKARIVLLRCKILLALPSDIAKICLDPAQLFIGVPSPFERMLTVNMCETAGLSYSPWAHQNRPKLDEFLDSRGTALASILKQLHLALAL